GEAALRRYGLPATFNVMSWAISVLQQLYAFVNLVDQPIDPGLGLRRVAGGLESSQQVEIVYLLVQISNLLLVLQVLLLARGQLPGKCVRPLPFGLV
ncbi:MAG: hypothetical protein J6U28_09420, partial [Bacteroidales bacterium]|nr:hypothetical protein [Bacteroidales bacterium]